MLRTHILMLFALLFLSCGEQVVEKPEKLIPKDQMVDLLYDLAILTAAKNTNESILTRNDIEIMDYLYKKYDIDSTRLVHSNTYYASVPAEYLDIYTQVDKRLGSEQERFEEERAQKADSIRQSNDAQRAKTLQKK
tara:strand:+ start:183580 stop:183987 length:408 start_codon:yes stop_codon:yes gene_type:complete